ncbi:MAG: Rieske (2Fe-2S) protein [Chlorobi bacterium]|nr:Rieske (2Fe-2S) protein [Chlorobiota bacterium]
MLSDKEHNRRFFLKSALAVVALAFIGLWDKMLIRHKQINKVNTFTFPLNFDKKISFAENYIIIRSKGNFKVLSSRCTHLGCRINEAINDQLICPCHGSSYDLNGNATKGPATRPLATKKFIIDEKTKTISIKS